MIRPDDHTILIEENGHLLAHAEVYPTDQPGLVHSEMHIESGHHPGGTGTRLVDAVLEHPKVDEVKKRLPIWKRQVFTDGEEEWVACP